MLQGEKGYPVTEIVLHCSATQNDWMSGKSVEEKRAEIDRWHKARGWRGFGYHWLIDRDGHVIAGRPESMIGAHVKGHNAGTIGICLVGGATSAASDRFEENFTKEQRAATWHMIRAISKRADIQKVTGHNRYAAKACPGFEASEEFPWPPQERTAPLYERAYDWVRSWFPG